MKRLLNFFSWLFKACCLFVSDKLKPIKASNSTPLGYQIDYSEDVPKNMKNDTVYIIQDGLEPESLAFKCPCG